MSKSMFFSHVQMFSCLPGLNQYKVLYTVKPVQKGHSKRDKTKILMTNGNLMKVESIAECSKGPFCNTFDLHEAIISLDNQFLVFLKMAILHTFYCMPNILL